MKTVIFSAYFFAFAFLANATAQTIDLTYHGTQGSPAGRAILFFADEIADCAESGLTVKPYFSSTLMSAPSAPSAVSEGAVDMAVVYTDFLREFSRDSSLLSVPFVFNNRRHWEAALQGDVYAHLKAQLESGTGIRLLGFLGGEEYGIVSQSPIASLDDFKGVKIRSPQGFDQILASFGASVINIPFSETFTALQSGTVSAAEMSAPLALQTKAFEVAGEYTRTNHRIFTEFMIINAGFFDGLNEVQKECVLTAANDATSFARTLVVDAENAALNDLQARGVQLLRIRDRSEMFQLASAERNKIISEMEAGGLFEKIVAAASCPSWCTANTCNDSECGLCEVCE